MRQRPRRSLIAIGALLITVFGLAGWWLATKGSTPHTVVMAAADLEGGKPVTADQLTTVEVSGADSASTIDGVALQSLVGQRPVGDIPNGTILASGSLSSKITPDEGQAIVPIGVTRAQMPSIGLSTGDAVTIVVTYGTAGDAQNSAPAEGGGTGGGVGPGTSWKATVVAVGEPGDDQTRTVDVALNSGPAAELAAASGTGRLSIVVTQTGNGR